MASYQQPRHDLTKVPVQDGVWVEVYWRDDAAGRGPCASLYVRDVEIMRFDCFPGDQGHCHVNFQQNRGQRWYYPPGTVREHIEQSAFDLGKNVAFCLRSNQDAAIQEMRIDPEKLQEAARRSRERLLALADQLRL
jgi:hypothetical protein